MRKVHTSLIVRTHLHEVLIRSLIIPEDEQLVAPDWAAHRTAKLVPLERVSCVRKEICRVQIVVSQKLEPITVPSIGSRLCYNTHSGGRRESILRLEVVYENLEFLGGIGIRERSSKQVLTVHGILAIQHVIRASLPPAGCGTPRVAGVGDIALEHPSGGIDNVDYSRREKHQRGGFRPFSGKSTMALCVIRFSKVAVPVCTNSALAETCTVCICSPTVGVASIVATWSAAKIMSVRVRDLKPGWENVKV